MILKAHFILYVTDQKASTNFYSTVLAKAPSLNVTGMTEFELPGGGILGLMPANDIKQLLGAEMPDPNQARGIPRAELYLLVDNPASYHERALLAGALELAPLERRTWGHRATYCLDPDGHVLAFATEE